MNNRMILRRPPCLSGVLRHALGVLLFAALAGPVWSQQRQPDLTDRSLEDLMNIEVTSVSKKEQRLSHTAAAVFVITQEDIRRSGATTIPDLLRMVPGVDVAQIDANKWAISIRGFNDRFGTKLLVLVDGRTVYSPLFSGVYWDTLDTLLEDIERIEVIRGPGASVWGANAVNGVINIITKHARETQSGLLTAGGGNQELGFGAFGYGGALGEKAYYRFYTKYFNRNHFDALPGQVASDDWQIGHSGFRLDWAASGRDSLTVEGDIYGGATGQTISQLVSFSPPFRQEVHDTTELAGGYALTRWTRTLSGKSDMSLQFYFDRTNRDEATYGENRNTYDLDFQHHLRWGERQDIVWGLGYRFTSDEIGTRLGLTATPQSLGIKLFSAFAQDEISLISNRLSLTLGSKFEHNDFTEFEIQPTARLMWTPHPQHAIWGAVSRAVRTPSRAEETVQFITSIIPGPGGINDWVTVFGNPAFRSEELLAYELGYRLQPVSQLSLDIATFYNRYSNLRTGEQGAPFLRAVPPPLHVVIPVSFGNQMHGETSGVEIAMNWSVTHRWKLSPGYSWFHEVLRLDPTSTATSAPQQAGDNPKHQFQARSSLSLLHNLDLDTALYYVGGLDHQRVPDYSRFDARLAWRPSESVEFSAVVQNAFKKHHQEFGNTELNEQATLVPRSAYVKLTWRFK